MEHPIVRFYVMRYREGKTTIPAKWKPMVMDVLDELKEDEK